MEKKCVYESKLGFCEMLSTTTKLSRCVKAPCKYETYAYWIPSKEGTYCSECGKMALMTIFDEEKLSNYCPNCGLPMVGILEVEKEENE